MGRPYILACILYMSKKNVFSSSEKFEHFIWGSLSSHRVYTTLQHTYSIEYAILLMKKINIIVKINH